MATVINNPSTGDDGGNGMGFLLGVILLVLVVFLFFFYGLPSLRGNMSGTSPQGGGPPQLNVPDKINLNVNQTK